MPDQSPQIRERWIYAPEDVTILKVAEEVVGYEVEVAENERLREAIERHRDEFQGPGGPCCRDRRLWAALEVPEDA